MRAIKKMALLLSFVFLANLYSPCLAVKDNQEHNILCPYTKIATKVGWSFFWGNLALSIALSSAVGANDPSITPVEAIGKAVFGSLLSLSLFVLSGKLFMDAKDLELLISRKNRDNKKGHW